MIFKLCYFKNVFDKLLKLRQEMAWILFGQFLGFIGGFIGIKVLTNIMGPKGYGKLALGFTIAGVFTTYVYGPVANVVARFFAAFRERGDLSIYFAVIKGAHCRLATILTIIAVAAAAVTGITAGYEWFLIVLLASLFGVVSGINGSYLSLQSAIRQRKIVALHQGADVWLRIALSILLLLAWNNTSYVVLLGYLLGTLIITVSQNRFAMKNEDIKRHWNAAVLDRKMFEKTRREFFAYAASFVVFAGFAIVSLYADRWIIQIIGGENMVGVYAAIFQIASSPVNLLFALINQLMIPIVFERAGTMSSENQARESAALMWQTVLVALLAALPILIVSFVFSEPIIRIFTNRTFAASHTILWLLVLGLTIYNIGQIFCLKGMYSNRPKIYFWPKGVQAAALIGFGYLLTWQHGVLGMAWSIILSSVVYVLAVMAVNRKIRVEPFIP